MTKDWWEQTFPQGKQTLIITDAQGYPTTIAYGEKGQGRPLILLHGLGSWSYNWRHLITPLSTHFRVICCDAKGFGFSEKALFRREVTGHQVIELERIIAALCDQPPIIVSESIGALIALGLATKNHRLISRLVVINAPIFTESLPHWAMGLLAKTPIEIIEVIDYLRLPYLFAPLVREVMGNERRKVLFDPTILTPEDVYWITYPFIEIPGTLVKVTEDIQIAIQEIDKVAKQQPNMLTDIQKNLNMVECETLILWGEQDSWFPPTHGEKLHQNLPNSRLKILPNCNHDASGGSPQIIYQEIIRFLKETNF
ncbi:alpha/beta hydrolase [Anabaena sp. FACHB-1237]|uniref:alpha/beta fold hydrolase n=1 Tax=Anabaena sp. FACHB-1237 TaxID=2692769 RepID=UPI0016803F8C|nr:alpha/beta hydrolase [Anabaena sp. FACHB-1237]MBD2138828.1 alpha/beta hydrolase [Anabaena sp. FACHB-1237]